jgi:hypothetical protein
MFENEIKFINDFALNKTKDLGSLFTIEQLLSSDLHPCIKRYVGSEINFLIHKDRKNLIENSLFDYSGAKISNYFNLIADEIKKTKKVSFEDVKNIILQAVSFNANFVMRPKWALAKLIFGNNKSVSVNDVQMLLNYTYYYEYLNNVFLAYLTKKKILNISLTEFELIMNKIDRELFTLHQSKLVDNALYAIADYYSIGGLNKSSITVEAVEVFLKEKNLTELLFKLKRGFPNPTRKKIDIDDIRKVLYSEFPLDNSLIGEKEQEEARDDVHFENPLKEVIVTSTKEDVKSEAPESESKIDEVFEEEISTIDSGSPEEKTTAENVESENLTYESFDLSSIESRSDEVFSEEIESNSNIKDENINESNEDEKVLDSFIEDVEKNDDDEIIIVDEKEENLLDFFDNENEISIDDDEGIKIEDFKSEIQNIEDEEKDELNFVEMPLQENQLETDEPTEGKIEFEHENGEKSDKPEENTETEKTPVLDKTNFEDIFSFLSAKEIDRIIKNLFNSDSEDFANTVEKMAACNSFEEANSILENTFQYARIKPHSKDATILTKAVTKYFSQGH